jgi:hypothetical protein
MKNNGWKSDSKFGKAIKKSDKTAISSSGERAGLEHTKNLMMYQGIRETLIRQQNNVGGTRPCAYCTKPNYRDIACRNLDKFPKKRMLSNKAYCVWCREKYCWTCGSISHDYNSTIGFFENFLPYSCWFGNRIDPPRIIIFLTSIF